MEACAIDHLNIRIPDHRIDETVHFYRDVLGLEVEDLAAYRDGDRPLFSFRLTPESIIHVSPVDPSSFEAPTRTNFRHLAIVFDADIEEIREAVEGTGVNIRRSSTPLGTTGRKPAIYVDDPCGYVLELKAGR